MELRDLDNQNINNNSELQEKERFKINDDKGAEWTLKKIKQAEQEMNRLMELVEAEKNELKRKESKIKKEYERNKEYFTSLLEEYYRENELDVKETKTQFSYKLLSGDLIYKKKKKKIIKSDEKKLIEELNDTEFVEEVKKLKWGELKKQLEIVNDSVVNKVTGEIYDGVDIEVEPEAFNVKLK